MRNQQTLSKSAFFNGIGLHSGNPVSMAVHPAPVHTGIVFVRQVGEHILSLPASIDFLGNTDHCTTLESEDFRVQTVEHILAAVHVELPYLVDRHATGDAGSDDRAGTGAAGEVEPIGQDQLRIPGQPAQVPFDGAQNLNRHHAEDPATVACQDLLRARCSNSFT